MRLIDADALKETIVSNVYPVVDDFNNHDYGMFWTGGIEKAIDEQPTIEERKTGKWEKVDDMWDDNVYKCSACYGMFNLIEGTPQDNDMNYCPYCGARMMETKEGEVDREAY